MEQKKTGKWKLISRFLKGNVHMFVLVFIFSMLNTLFNALTPQIVRIFCGFSDRGERTGSFLGGS